MSPVQPRSVATTPTAAGAILRGTLICGVLDISAAIINVGLQGMPPLRLLQTVAAGLLGRDAAITGGVATGALGLGMHFGVAFTVTVIFYALSRWFPILLKHVFLVGLLYGAGVYLTMNTAVLPLLSWIRSLYLPTVPVSAPRYAWPQFFIHLACVGLPVVGSMARWAPSGRSSAAELPE